MKFTIDREALLGPIQAVSGVVERRQTMPVLSNLLCELEDGRLTLTGTDQEVELQASTDSVVNYVNGDLTIPARKFLDICKSLPNSAEITLEAEQNKINIISGRFKSSLSTLDSNEFPIVEMGDGDFQMSLSAEALRGLLEKTSFAMAQQDVRYFFNGMLLELEAGSLRAVATNGQRLATSAIEVDYTEEDKKQFIVPRKSIIEIARMVKEGGDRSVKLAFTGNHLRVSVGSSQLTTKLVDAQYPEYKKVIDEKGDKVLYLNRLALKEALSRIAILSNEVYRNVRLSLNDNLMLLNANNPMQEEAEESIAIEYNGDEIEIGFNVSYLIEVLAVLKDENVNMTLSDSHSAMLLTCLEDKQSTFVVSPMML